MEKLLLRLTFSACVVIGGIALNSYSSGGFSSDLTGSPLSSSTCQNSCHNTYSLNAGSGSVSMTVPANYYPGSTYSVSLNVNQTSPSPARYGFMAGVLRDNNANGGSFTAGTGSAATTISGRSYIRQNSTFNSTGSWSFSWTAPSFTDTITFYYVGNAANGASGNNGDYIYTSSTTIYPINQIVATIDSTAVTCNAACDGEITVSNVSGGEGGPYTYDWSNSATTASITGLCTGTYTVTIEDVNGNEESFEVTVDTPLPLVGTFSSTGTSCVEATGSISVAPAGGTQPYSYLWSTGSTDSLVSGVGPGNYVVTVTDANGCTYIDSSDVQFTGSGLVAVFGGSDENCGQANGFLTVNMVVGNPPYSYNWSTGSTSSVSSGLTSGTYTVTVTDSNGCTDVFTESITEIFAEIDVNGAVINDVTCFGDSNGSISVEASQGVEPWTFDWSDGSSGGTAFDLVAGTYTVTMTDSAGCTDVESFTIGEPDSLVLSALPDSSNATFCLGSIVVSVSGGTAPFSYDWSHDPLVMTDSAGGLCPGVYTISVNDANGCESEIEVLLKGPTGLSSVELQGLVVYPNPTQGEFSIDAPNVQDLSLELLDLSGRTLKSWQVMDKRSLDVSSFSAGRYMLRFSSENGVFIRPLIIQR